MAANAPRYSIIRRKQLEAKIGLSRTAIYDRLNPNSPRHDPTFPTPISLGAGAVGWVESEVNAWIESRIAASRQAA
ncbi:AlpA family transcriptional regulator [Crenobacter luteus]|uniref:helix-turn-helix transcriptional regulator n=1 Tax=Crenobacter luteus TaxID=1452487 RepID=UPI0010438D5C|nr:AlpA family phage regulatory protein [Crenobacter luteus]TCP10896.1 AlpA family transcriptional regulator [Crenobacter luteus]